MRSVVAGPRNQGRRVYPEFLDVVDRWRTLGGTPDDVVGAACVTDLRAKVVPLLVEMFHQARPSKP